MNFDEASSKMPARLFLFLIGIAGFIGIAGLVVWYLASGAQGPRINTQLGHSRLGRGVTRCAVKGGRG